MAGKFHAERRACADPTNSHLPRPPRHLMCLCGRDMRLEPLGRLWASLMPPQQPSTDRLTRQTGCDYGGSPLCVTAGQCLFAWRRRSRAGHPGASTITGSELPFSTNVPVLGLRSVSEAGQSRVRFVDRTSTGRPGVMDWVSQGQGRSCWRPHSSVRHGTPLNGIRQSLTASFCDSLPKSCA